MFSNKFLELPFTETGGQNITLEQTREDFTYPSFCGGIGTLPALFSFDSTDVTLIPPLGCQTFFTLSTKSAVPFPSKNSSMLLFLIKNSAWYRGIPDWHIEKWSLFQTLWDMSCSPRPTLTDYARIKTNQDKKQRIRKHVKGPAVTVVHTTCKQMCAVSRDVTKISSCQVNTTSRRGIKQLGISFSAMFLLF